MEFIYHITTSSWWNRFSSQDFYESPTMKEEGFIHCSKKEQVVGVLERYYSNEKNLLLLEIDSRLLTAPLKFEVATNGESFPHVFGTLNKNAIVRVDPI
jgi:uncharacterized protein (DUF952 family)